MAIYRCTEDNQIDKRYYSRGSLYTFDSDPGASRFELVPAEEADGIIDNWTPLPAYRDVEDDWHIDVDVEFERNVEFETLIAQSIELNTAGPVKPWKAGQIQFDPDSGVHLLDSAIEGVRNNAGEELWYGCINNNADDIANGAAVYASGICPVTGRIEVSLAIASSPFTSLQTLGLATAIIKGTNSEPATADNRVGKVTHFGEVRDFDTSSLSASGVMWLSATVAGEVTGTKPTVGSQLILLGTVLKSDALVGKAWVKVNITANSVPSYKSETFSSRGVGAGTYYLFGDYLAPPTDATLSNASLSQAIGTANAAYGMRPFAVFAGDGTVDTGQVGLRWTSTSITDGGVRVAGDVQIITEDITAPLLNDYLETPKKIIGAGIYELYVVSGSPTAYSVSFNYGLIKYEDFGNRDFVLTDVEITGLAGATDTSFQFILQKQSVDGWTYSAAGFSPGDGVITSMSSVYVLEDNVINGEAFHFKLDSTALGDVILGSGSEGIIAKLVTTQNNTIQYLNCHIGASF